MVVTTKSSEAACAFAHRNHALSTLPTRGVLTLSGPTTGSWALSVMPRPPCQVANPLESMIWAGPFTAVYALVWWRGPGRGPQIDENFIDWCGISFSNITK